YSQKPKPPGSPSLNEQVPRFFRPPKQSLLEPPRLRLSQLRGDLRLRPALQDQQRLLWRPEESGNLLVQRGAARRFRLLRVAPAPRGANAIVMTRYVLPDLSYDYSALEPHISGEIMELHHDKHHRKYVDTANKTLEKLEAAR